MAPAIAIPTPRRWRKTTGAESGVLSTERLRPNEAKRPMKRNPGRPPKDPETPYVIMTMRVPAEFKRLLMEQADAYGMTMTEYIKMLVERDGS